LNPGDAVTLPPAPYLHLFVPRGRITLESIGELDQGDAVRFADADGRRVTADHPSEVLIWEMHAELGG
jgi:quercetin 2,3-dioxygenase